MKKVATVKIDKEKVRREIFERNLNGVRMSREMGFGSSTLNNWISIGEIPVYGMNLLTKMYNIAEQDIVKLSEEVNDKQNNDVITQNNSELMDKLESIDNHLIELIKLFRETWVVKG